MAKKCIIAIDEGTTGTRSVAFDSAGRVIFRAYRTLSIAYPRPGWVEQDPAVLWQSTYETLREVAKLCLAADYSIEALAISNQRETTVAWDRITNEPLMPAIVWQCRRTTDTCQKLRSDGLEPLILKLTGLPIDPYFSATKMAWILEQLGSKEKFCLGTVDSWLLWNLTQGQSYATDVTNASRTQLMNIYTLAWDEKLCEIFGVPSSLLPEIKKSGDHFGTTRGLVDIPDGIPILAMIGDSQAALFGEGALKEGMGKVTYGTGSSVLMNIGSSAIDIKEGLGLTIAWQFHDKITYAVEGIIHATGTGIEWLRDSLDLFSDSSETEAMAKSVRDTGGVYFVPAFSGLGTPWWDPNARGLLIGLTGGTRPEHIVRAALDAIALQVYDVFTSFREAYQIDTEMIFCGGGASRNGYLMQLQADLLQCPLATSSNHEVSAQGAAYLAGLMAGMWNTRDIEAMHKASLEKYYYPEQDLPNMQHFVGSWHEAVQRSLGWVK
ncbi:MAG: glycerol kinase GlpK [Firmicutes bacterium]|nr:glycerol kinase GlpK [Bacillota bacterium]